MRNKNLQSLKIFFIMLVIFQFGIQGNITEVKAKGQRVQAKNKLFIPKLIDSRQSNHDIELEIQNTQHEFFVGVKSSTKGFSQSYLGPTIRLYKGEDTRIRYENNIGEATTVHGHGLHISGEVDGGPQNKILAGKTWDIVLPIRQEASTNWYHPHFMGKTAEHVHAGLAGLYLIEDENSQALALPKNYGIDDIPIVVQDRSFTNGKMNAYHVSDAELADGNREDTLVINGTVDPFLEVPQGWIRLRLLNGSNARFYKFYLESKKTFYKIATEGGFLEKPIPMTSLKMAAGERNEIMIDVSDGEIQILMATLLPADNEGLAKYFAPKKRVLEIRVDTTRQGKGTLPEKLNTIIPWKHSEASVTRTFDMQIGDGEDDDNDDVDGTGLMYINGKVMDMSRINERVKKGDIEIWRIKGSHMEHPFHVHGTSFLILSQSGQAPKPEDYGWKDTVVVSEDEWTDVIMKFNYEATDEYPYMYHCHILEHEDAGMMGQFTVQ